MAIDVHDPGLLELLDPQAELEQLGGGFTFTEGPLWVPEGAGYLLVARARLAPSSAWIEAARAAAARSSRRTTADAG